MPHHTAARAPARARPSGAGGMAAVCFCGGLTVGASPGCGGNGGARVGVDKPVHADQGEDVEDQNCHRRHQIEQEGLKENVEAGRDGRYTVHAEGACSTVAEHDPVRSDSL